MLDYKADPDIRTIMVNGRITIPRDLDEAEAGRLHRFLTSDQVLERFYLENPPPVRPPEDDLRVAAETAMACRPAIRASLSRVAKFAVLQAGIAGSPENLDSAEVQEWAYSRIEENPDWLAHEDVAFDQAKPIDWLRQVIGAGVLLRRQLMEEPPNPPKRRRWFDR